MKLIDINPFVRTILKIKIFPFFKNVVSVDCRLFYILEGNGTVYINDAPYKFKTGSLMLWQGGTKYRIESDNNLSLITVNFDYDMSDSTTLNSYKTISENIENLNISNIHFDDCEYLNKPLFIETATYFRDVIANLNSTIEEKPTQSKYCYEKRSVYFKNCILNLIENINADIKANDYNRLNKIINYIKTNYYENITNSCLADLVGYHPYYLNKLFSDKFGVTMHQYLLNHRLTIAENLLVLTDKQITDIALETGFTSAISFTVNFKNKYGISPSEYRKKIRNQI